MKVIHVLHSLKYSGAEIMYVDAAPFFQDKGCDLTVMATAVELGEYSPFFERAGYKVLHHPIPPLKNYGKRIQFYKAFTRLLKKEKFDVLHVHSSGAMWGMALCAWLAHVKCVYTFHNVFPTRFFSYPYHVLLRWTAKHIFKCRFQTISDSVYEHELRFYHNKTAKVYNWFGNNRYFPAINGEKSTVRKALGIGENTLVLISIGGCSSVKRHSDIIKALPIILKEIPDCLYLHLGKGSTESAEAQLAMDLGVSKQVRFCGNQDMVRNYLVASDIYLMPSIYEGISITTIEAMACNIPAILYDVPGLRDFNKYGNNSILIPEDFRLLAREVIKLNSSPNDLTQMANQANNMANELFNLNKNADKIFNLYAR